MRPLISWADLAGRRVGVWGPAGVEGQANVRKLAALGVTPAVLVDDSPSGGGGPGGAAVLATADGGLDALAACDVVVKAPGISRYREDARWLAGRGVAITGGVGLWLAGLWLAGWADGHVIAITGTKGKSSTTAVAGHLLTRLGYPAMTGGNIGRLPYDPDLDQAGPPPRYWVIEVSSYQALDLPVSAPVTAVTSLHPDHLPWHGGVGQYYADKLSACSQPGAEVTVANGDSVASWEGAQRLINTAIETFGDLHAVPPSRLLAAYDLPLRWLVLVAHHVAPGSCTAVRDPEFVGTLQLGKVIRRREVDVMQFAPDLAQPQHLRGDGQRRVDARGRALGLKVSTSSAIRRRYAWWRPGSRWR